FPARTHERTPRYGIGAFELLNGIYKDLFEVKRRFPSRVVLPILPRKHELFWASAVGCLPPAFKAEVVKSFSEAIDIEEPQLAASTFPEIMGRSSITPRRIGTYSLTTERQGGGFSRDAYCLFMDADNFADIVDYWNLRALGRSVLPIAKQFIDVPEYIEFIRQF